MKMIQVILRSLGTYVIRRSCVVFGTYRNLDEGTVVQLGVGVERDDGDGSIFQKYRPLNWSDVRVARYVLFLVVVIIVEIVVVIENSVDGSFGAGTGVSLAVHSGVPG